MPPTVIEKGEGEPAGKASLVVEGQRHSSPVASVTSVM